MNKKQKNRKGVTLIEVLFVLGISAILLGLVMTLYSSNNMKVDSNNVLAELAEFRSIAQELYGSEVLNGNYQDISTALKNSGLVPLKYTSMIGLQTMNGEPVQVLLNAWGGQYIFRLYDIPKAECVSLATTPVGNGSDIHDINVNGFGPGGSGGSMGLYNIGVLTPSQAIQACSSNSNWMIFNFKVL